MRIRRARPADAAVLSDLARRAKASWGYPAPWLDAWRAELTVSPDYLAAQTAFVADIDGRPAGLCVIEDHGARWSLEHVWVAPEVQGRGVGRTLVARALDEAASRRPGPVEVLSDPHAESFYLRLGARRVGAVPAPMPGAPDRVLPRLLLDAAPRGTA
ncbi:MAG: GNAT family N-acetyltransferase [Vicinamibacterales bacterium]